MHPSKATLVQELYGNDTDCYYENWKSFNQLQDIISLLGDKAKVHLSGHVNKHNKQYQLTNNPNWIKEEHFQCDIKSTV